uniref:Uncharacterized protein n=1 Tax=Rhizophora mucronata TaxID=61149 RepID=A0A2P2PYX2_RHIMU
MGKQREGLIEDAWIYQFLYCIYEEVSEVT